jgi:hypothetical protein
MSRSVLKPEHVQAMKDLRAWARKQGNTPAATLNPANVQADKARSDEAHAFVKKVAESDHSIIEALAQGRDSASRTEPSESTRTPAPDISQQGADD